jgi:hypothetical protein
MEIAMGDRLLAKFNSTEERDAFRLQVCREFISSGLSKAIFCDNRNISYSSLYRWLEYFKDNPALPHADKPLHTAKDAAKASLRKKSSVKNNFIRVNVEQQAPVQTNSLCTLPTFTQPSAELVFPNGLRLIINQIINADLVSHLLQAMR